MPEASAAEKLRGLPAFRNKTTHPDVKTPSPDVLTLDSLHHEWIANVPTVKLEGFSPEGAETSYQLPITALARALYNSRDHIPTAFIEGREHVKLDIPLDNNRVLTIDIPPSDDPNFARTAKSCLAEYLNEMSTQLNGSLAKREKFAHHKIVDALAQVVGLAHLDDRYLHNAVNRFLKEVKYNPKKDPLQKLPTNERLTRRRFLRLAGAGGAVALAATAIGTANQPNNPPQEKPVLQSGEEKVKVAIKVPEKIPESQPPGLPKQTEKPAQSPVETTAEQFPKSKEREIAYPAIFAQNAEGKLVPVMGGNHSFWRNLDKEPFVIAGKTSPLPFEPFQTAHLELETLKRQVECDELEIEPGLIGIRLILDPEIVNNLDKYALSFVVVKPTKEGGIDWNSDFFEIRSIPLTELVKNMAASGYEELSKGNNKEAILLHNLLTSGKRMVYFLKDLGNYYDQQTQKTVPTDNHGRRKLLVDHAPNTFDLSGGDLTAGEFFTLAKPNEAVAAVALTQLDEHKNPNIGWELPETDVFWKYEHPEVDPKLSAVETVALKDNELIVSQINSPRVDDMVTTVKLKNEATGLTRQLVFSQAFGYPGDSYGDYKYEMDSTAKCLQTLDLLKNMLGYNANGVEFVIASLNGLNFLTAVKYDGRIVYISRKFEDFGYYGIEFPIPTAEDISSFDYQKRFNEEQINKATQTIPHSIP